MLVPVVFVEARKAYHATLLKEILMEPETLTVCITLPSTS
jgi:hypothetical protein